MIIEQAAKLETPPEVTEDELDEDDDYIEGPSDFVKFGVFLANALMFFSFFASILMLPNLGGAPMIASFVIAIFVSLLNVKFFFVPRDGEDETSDDDSTGPIAPYVILAVMVVMISLLTWVISLKSR